MRTRLAHFPLSLFTGVRALLLALLIPVMVLGCGDTINQNVVPATVGSLAISVSPASAAVTVTGPDSFSQSFTGSETLVDLEPGVYTATAQENGYSSQSDSAAVAAGNQSILTLLLSPTGQVDLTTGSLTVSVVPGDAEVTLTGPDDFREEFTGSETFVELEPGEYSGSADADGYVMQTDVTSVFAGQQSILTLILTPVDEQAAVFNSLTVSVSPSSAEVTLTGPNSFSHSFTGSETFVDLDEGVYTGTASATGFVTQSDTTVVFAGQQSILTLYLRPDAEEITTGRLVVGVQPVTASVIVTGPSSYRADFIGGEALSGLTPGDYHVYASIDGYVPASDTIRVSAGATSSIDLVLLPRPPTASPRYVYRNNDGNLVTISREDVLAGRFVFYAWLQDLSGGINTSSLSHDPGAPSLDEQVEFAPSFTQNLTAGWVGYRDSAGVVRPVIGAEVRWEIDQQYADRVGSMQYGIADGNVIYDDQANTITNNGRLFNELFPLGTDYALYNNTGVGSPNADGFTWVTLFSPDTLASARIVAVASIYGIEIGKEILYKDFGPTPVIEITKTVTPSLINLGDAASGTATFTVTVSNTGLGDAENVDLADYLSDGNGAYYNAFYPVGTNTGDDFDISFPLDAGDDYVLTFTAVVTGTGIFCNTGEVEEFSGNFGTINPIDLLAEACFTVTRPRLTIFKQFVTPAGASLGQSVTVPANQAANLRVTVTNYGTGTSPAVTVNDVLSSVNGTGVTVANANYSITLPTHTPAAVANARDGFDVSLGTIAAGATVTLDFTVTGTIDGVYCDTASIPGDSSTACLTVATPHLTITKVDVPMMVMPGDTYRSTIVVTNDGHSTAHGVVIADLLGINEDVVPNVTAIYVSSSLNGLSGTLYNGKVTAGAVDIAAGQSMTFTVFSLIPFGGAPGDYCDIGSFTSTDAGSGQVEVCVEVPAFSALQTQLVDRGDPIAAGGTLTYQAVLFVEPRSNEGVDENELTYSFGLDDPLDLGDPGEFTHVSTRIYLDTAPVLDSITGLVISDPSSSTATLMTTGFTLTNTTPGLETIVFTPGFMIQPNQAMYIVHEVLVPAATVSGQYTTSYIWDSVGSDFDYSASSSESTTVIQ